MDEQSEGHIQSIVDFLLQSNEEVRLCDVGPDSTVVVSQLCLAIGDQPAIELNNMGILHRRGEQYPVVVLRV